MFLLVSLLLSPLLWSLSSLQTLIIVAAVALIDDVTIVMIKTAVVSLFMFIAVQLHICLPRSKPRCSQLQVWILVWNITLLGCFETINDHEHRGKHSQAKAVHAVGQIFTHSANAPEYHCPSCPAARKSFHWLESCPALPSPPPPPTPPCPSSVLQCV